MTELATPSDYTKEYLPGYTGHVPSKNERFGATAGQIKREILADSGRHPIILDSLRTRDNSKRLYAHSFVPPIDDNKIIYHFKVVAFFSFLLLRSYLKIFSIQQ